MVILPHTAPESSIENHCRPQLPDADLYMKDFYLVPFVREPEGKIYDMTPRLSDPIRYAIFKKKRHEDKYSGYYWEYDGVRLPQPAR